MLVFPFAKINLGLQVLGKRPDGYHNIRTAMLPIRLNDALEAVVDMELPAGEVRFTRTGINVPGNPADDLCMKAVDRIKAKYPLPGLRMHLHKAIPAGAGLGGGSSDGAHALLLLNRLLDLQIPQEELHAMASSLGSDCAFFLQQGPQLAEGRGEQLSPLAVELNGLWLVLVAPGLHVSTVDVYQHMKLLTGHDDLRTALATPTAQWQGNVQNDMEEYVFAKHPEVARIKQQLLGHGALYASMSGSGSSVFGLFSSKPNALAFPDHYHVWAMPV